MSIDVYALIGKSGSGKSHQATALAKQIGIDAIIDDGLLISGNRIMAGRSAKAELTRMAAVRRAIFQDTEHAKEVIYAIAKLAPASVLILGTSENMVRIIAKALELPGTYTLYSIFDLMSSKEIEEAIREREESGTHVIPVAQTEVRRLIPVALVDAFDTMLRGAKIERSPERTHVKPLFAQGGQGLSFALTTISPLISQAVEDMGDYYSLQNVTMTTRNEPVLSMVIHSTLSGFDIEMLTSLQIGVSQKVRAATGRSIHQIDLIITGLR